MRRRYHDQSQACKKALFGKVKVNLHQRDKSIKTEELSAKVTDCKSLYEESGFVDNKRHLQIQQHMNCAGADHVKVAIVNQIDISVGDQINLDVKGAKIKGKYYALSVKSQNRNICRR